MAKQSNPGALEGEQLISLSEPFGGWAEPVSSVATPAHFQASIEGVEAPTFAKQNTNQYAESDGVSLFQVEKFGHIGPGYGFSITTDTAGSGGTPLITDLPLNGDTESNANYGVLVLKNGRVVQIASDASATIAKYDPTAHTPVSSPNGDMIIFRDFASTVVEWVIWSYEYSGGADIDIAHAANFSSPVSGFWSSTLAGPTLNTGVPHKLCVGPDGNIYVTDGPYIRQINVTAGLVAATLGNVLNIGSGWTAISVSSYNNYVAVIASKKQSTFSRSETKVFLWDGTTTTSAGVTSTAPQYKFDIPDNFGNGLFYDGTTLYAFTNGRNFSSKIWQFTGKTFKKIFETPFIVSSTSSLQGGVDVYQDGFIIAAVKNGISNNNLGHLFRLYGNGFHDEGYISDGDNLSANIATSVGMCRTLNVNGYQIGVKYGTSYGVFYRNPNKYQTSTAASPTIDLRSILYTSGILGRRQYPMGFKMTVSRIKLFFSQWGTGASLYLSAFKGYDTCLPGNEVAANGGVDLLNILIDTNSSLPNGPVSGLNPGNYNVGYYHYCLPVGSYEIDLSNIGIVNVSSFYFNIRWTHTSPTAKAAVIRRMELHVAQSQ